MSYFEEFRRENGFADGHPGNNYLPSEVAKACAEVDALRAKLAEAEINSAFWLAHEKQSNQDFEKDYLAIWKAIKQPNLTVLESALALRATIAALEADKRALREALGGDFDLLGLEVFTQMAVEEEELADAVKIFGDLNSLVLRFRKARIALAATAPERTDKPKEGK